MREDAMRRKTLILAGAIVPLLAAPAVADMPGSVENGRKLALEWCSNCHMTGANRLATDVAPTFREIAEDRSADYIRGFLANPHFRGSMPPFDISRQQIEDLVAYIKTLR